MTCCFTGHRKFPWGQADPRHKDMLLRLEAAIDAAIAAGTTHFICGNAVGVDTWAAEIVLRKKAKDPNITLEIALPFAGHNADLECCTRVQEKADLVHIVGKSKSRSAAFHERNHYMVDHSDTVIAVLDQSHAISGTAKTAAYAKRLGKKVWVINVGDGKAPVK